jgi:hypothetical protein
MIAVLIIDLQDAFFKDPVPQGQVGDVVGCNRPITAAQGFVSAAGSRPCTQRPHADKA